MIPRLVPYIQKQIKNGYDINAVRNHLIRNGYDSREIDSAVNYIYSDKKKFPIWIFGIVFVLLILLFFLIRGFGEEEKFPEIVIPKVEVPEEPSEETTDISEPPESVPLVPSEQTCPSSCDDSNSCTTDYCGMETAYKCVHEAVIPCCGNNVCETDETCSIDCDVKEEVMVTLPAAVSVSSVIREARELASSSVSSAANYCSSLTEDRFSDSCYSTVADVSEQSSYCDMINSVIKKDSCYITAALSGDFTVCDKMTDEYLKTSCESLKDASG